METRTCQSCKKEFPVYEEDFKFYEKINVPPPTFCPLCRAQRRFAFRNERFLFRRKSDFSGKEIFTMFPSEANIKVYENSAWYGDGWDSLDYGKEVNFSRPFLAQFKELLETVPHMALSVSDGTMVNSDYSNNASYLKNCYLVFNADNNEDCMYSDGIYYSKDCIDVLSVTKSELVYEGFWVDHSSRIFFSGEIENSHDIYFSKNLRGCSNCFGCINLRSKNYYIFNTPYSKEEYRECIKAYELGSHNAVESLRSEAEEFYLKFPHKFSEGRNAVNSSGEYISNSKNIFRSYQVREGENLRYCQFLFAPANKDCADLTIWGIGNAWVYESAVCGLGTNNVKFSSECWPSVSNLEYCRYIQSSSDCFGCVSLRNKKYCILNKQYTKEEYEALRWKIVKHMNDMPYADKAGRVYHYGEFFPIEFSPFAYNQTIAQEYFPLTKERAANEGYVWKDAEDKNYRITVQAADLPDNVRDVGDDILRQIIGCAHRAKCRGQCTGAFRVTETELKFYRNMNFPFPRLCPNCRHEERTKKRNSIRLWKQSCQCAGQKSANGIYENTADHFHKTSQCPNEFETSFAPDRPEIVYCEACYQSEVV